MSTKMAIWVNEELENRGWSQRELARRAQLSHTTISKVLSGQTKASFEFCESIARALNTPPEIVFRMAGLLPPLSSSEDDSALKEILDTTKNMSPEKRQETLNYIRYLFQLQDEEIKLRKVSDAARLSGIPGTTSQATYHLGTQFGPKIVDLFSELNEERQTSVVEYIQWQIHLQKLEGSHKQEDVDESGIDSSESEESL